MNPNKHCNLVRYNILSVDTFITQELQVVHGCSTYQTTALLSEMLIFYVEDGFDIQLASYGSKHSSHSLSDKPLFVRVYTHSLKTIGANCPTTLL